jgi:uncharacterized membrane protein
MRFQPNPGLQKAFFVVAIGLIIPSSIGAQPATTQELPQRAIVLKAEHPADTNTDPSVYQVRFEQGPEKGKTVEIGDDESVTVIGYKSFEAGDRVYVTAIDHIDGSRRYVIQDYARGYSLWWLVGIFVLAVVWLSRWQGVRSLIGLAFTLLVIIGWVVPLIANGYNPIRVTLLASAAILVVTFIVTEGFSRKAAAAAIGTVGTMVLTGLLSIWAISFARLTGQDSEEAFFLKNLGDQTIDLQGLLLAGIIIGTLGLLDDIAVSQVATVAELRAAKPHMKALDLYNAALRVGRAHMAAIVNTLLLAYAGAALPILLLFNAGGQPLEFILNGEVIMTEVVRSVVGSLGLILAVPITTAVAVWLKVRSVHGESGIGHSH